MSDAGTRCLSLLQPWAELVADRQKAVETRSWGTKWRGRLLIHASGGKPVLDALRSPEIVGALHRPIHRLELGAIVATAELYDCVQVQHPLRPVPRLADSVTGWGGVNALHLDAQLERHAPPSRRTVALHGTDRFGHRSATEVDALEAVFGDLSIGRWAWLLRRVRRIQPVQARGAQGLWKPGPDLLAAVNDAEGAATAIGSFHP